MRDKPKEPERDAVIEIKRCSIYDNDYSIGEEIEEYFAGESIYDIYFITEPQQWDNDRDYFLVLKRKRNNEEYKAAFDEYSDDLESYNDWYKDNKIEADEFIAKEEKRRKLHEELRKL